ncbi:unnamed protein product [Urochloa humidicola]
MISHQPSKGGVYLKSRRASWSHRCSTPEDQNIPWIHKTRRAHSLVTCLIRMQVQSLLAMGLLILTMSLL